MPDKYIIIYQPTERFLKKKSDYFFIILYIIIDGRKMEQKQQHVEVVDNNEEEVEEEVIDDWGDILAGSNFQLFAKHETYNVYIPILVQQNSKQTKVIALTSSSNCCLTESKTTTTIIITTNNNNHVEELKTSKTSHCSLRDDNNDINNKDNNLHSIVTTIMEVKNETTIINKDEDEDNNNNNTINESSSSFEMIDFIKFHLLCVESLSPIDMINMSYGIHDSTGNCVWTGSFLFINALQELSKYFTRRRVIELGCGTGISSIALILSFIHTNNNSNDLPSLIVMTDGDPESIKLSYQNWILNFSEHNNNKNDTKNDDQMNASHDVTTNTANTVSTTNTNCELPDCIMKPFLWGTNINQDDNNNNTTYVCSSSSSHNDLNHDYFDYFDTVYATDVLYDITSLPSLLQSVTELLSLSSDNNHTYNNNTDHYYHDEEKMNNTTNDVKYFILSHVPRACYNEHINPQTMIHYYNCTTLEDYIIYKFCNESLFQLERIIRPLDLFSNNNHMILQNNLPNDALNHISLKEMNEIGAAIFIFKFLN